MTAKQKYENKKDFDSKLAKAEQKKAEHEGQLKEAEETEEKLLSEVAEVKAQLADAEATLKEAQEAEQAQDGLVREGRAALKEAEADHTKVTKAVNAQESELMVLRQKLHETLQKARVDEVELPTLGAGDAGGEEEDAEGGGGVSESQGSSRSSRRRASQPSETQESLVSSQHFSQGEDAKVAEDRREASRVDFSTMDEDLKMRRSAAEDDKLRKKFEVKISKLTQEIEGIAPNMKVGDFLACCCEFESTPLPLHLCDNLRVLSFFRHRLLMRSTP